MHIVRRALLVIYHLCIYVYIIIQVAAFHGSQVYQYSILFLPAEEQSSNELRNSGRDKAPEALSTSKSIFKSIVNSAKSLNLTMSRKKKVGVMPSPKDSHDSNKSVTTKQSSIFGKNRSKTFVSRSVVENLFTTKRDKQVLPSPAVESPKQSRDNLSLSVYKLSKAIAGYDTRVT